MTAAVQTMYRPFFTLSYCLTREYKNYLYSWSSVIPALWEAEADRSPEVRSSRPARPTWRNPVSTKNTKVSWVWWHMPVIPATREADAGKLLESRRKRLQ